MSGVHTLQESGQFDAAGKLDRHVIFAFGGPGCIICKRLAPILHAYAAQRDGALAVVEIDSERLSDLAARHDIRSLPTLLWFHDGVQAGRKSGYQTLPELRQWRTLIEAQAPSPAAAQA